MELNEFLPPNSSNDYCLLFCLFLILWWWSAGPVPGGLHGEPPHADGVGHPLPLVEGPGVLPVLALAVLDRDIPVTRLYVL